MPRSMGPQAAEEIFSWNFVAEISAAEDLDIPDWKPYGGPLFSLKRMLKAELT